MAEPSGDVIPTKNRIGRDTAVVGRVITWVVYAYVLVVEVILLLGFLLLLFGANPSAGFVEWAYRNLDRAMRPFRGIFEPIEIGVTGNDVPAVIETSVIFAMVVYGILALMLASLLHWLAEKISSIDRENRLLEERARYDDAMARSRGWSDAATEAAALRQAETVRAAQTSAPPGGAPAPASSPPPPPDPSA